MVCVHGGLLHEKVMQVGCTARVQTFEGASIPPGNVIIRVSGTPSKIIHDKDFHTCKYVCAYVCIHVCKHVNFNLFQ